jgi:hypothetical protein
MKPSEKLAEAYRLTERAAELTREAWIDMAEIRRNEPSLSAGQLWTRQAVNESVFKVMQALNATKLEAGIIYAVVADTHESDL